MTRGFCKGLLRVGRNVSESLRRVVEGFRRKGGFFEFFIVISDVFVEKIP